MKLIKKLFVLSIFALSLVLTGCFNFDDVKTLEFVQAPQSIYYLVGVDQAMEAQKEVLNDVTVKINGNVYTLSDAISKSLIQYEGLDLTTEGTKTLIVTLRENQNVRLTYVYKVVDGLAYELFAGGKGTESDPYKIETPQQFMNIATKVYGTPTPSTTEEDDWKRYYNAVMPYFTNGVYFKITKDLDFAGITYYPLGVLGGENFVPFTGTIDGQEHTIRNLTISLKGEISAMFGGLNGATIKNLNFENVSIPDLATKYAALITARPPKIEGENTNILFNLDFKSGTIIGTRAAAFATEATNTLFVKCNIGSNVQVVGFTNPGIISGFITRRSYTYTSAAQINIPATDMINHLMSWEDVADKLYRVLTISEYNSINLNSLNATYYDKSFGEGHEYEFHTAYIDCLVNGSLTAAIPEAFQNDILITTGGYARIASANCTFTTTKNFNFVPVEGEGKNYHSYEVYYSFNAKNSEPHNSFAIYGGETASETQLMLKYDEFGAVSNEDGFDNTYYRLFDIYGNPVQSSKYYIQFEIGKVAKLIKVYKNQDGNIIGITELVSNKVTDSTKVTWGA